jgi:peptidoglycan/LPS O-acetylase OafA/YrhL
MKLKFIDSIRGIAILMVIMVHISQNVDFHNTILLLLASYGQMGVQLFFIASAYTLCLSSFKRSNESLPLIKFAIRRYFRIAPAYYFGLVIYFLISLTRHLPLDKYNFLNVISNLFFIHGFTPSANNLVPGGWSIGTEMAFYALFPILFKIAQVKSTSVKNILKFIFSGIILSQLSLIILYLSGHKLSNNNFIYFNILNQLPVFLLGIGYFFLKKNYNYEFHWIFNLLLFSLFTGISISLWNSKINYLFSIIPLISGLSFIFLFELFQKFDFLNNKLLIRIGQVSFSMYLLHFISVQIVSFLEYRFFIINGTITLLSFYLASVFLTFGLALISEKYIEKPGIEFGKKLIKKLDVQFSFQNKA